MKTCIFSALLSILICLLIQNEGYSQSTYNKDFPKLSGLYRFDKEHIDYIVVIDRSGTVRPYWAEIKSAIINVINLSKDGDYITIIGFHSTSDYLVLPRSINPKVKQELISEVNLLQAPNGSFTDLFDSVDKALESINRPNGNSLQAVFYFTDFKNEPPGGSRWNLQNISLLDTKYLNYVLKPNKLVNVFAFQLPLDADAGKDYESFNKIFDQTVFKILVNAGSMDEWFVRLEDQLKRQRLNLRVKTDLKDFINLKSASTNSERIKLTIENRLPFDTYLNKVIIGSGSVSEIIKESYSNVTIKAKGQTDIYISAKTFLQKHPEFLEHTIRIEKPIFSLSFSFVELNTELAKLNIGQSATQQLALKEDLSFKIGIPYWVFVAIGIAIFFLFFLMYKTWFKPEWIFRQRPFRVSCTLDGKLLPNSTKKFAKSKQPIIIDHTIISSIDVSPEKAKIIMESKFKIYVVTSKPRFLTMNPRRGTYLFAESQGGNLTLKKNIKGKVVYSTIPRNRKLFTEQVSLYKGICIVGEFTSGITKTKLEINFYNN